MRRIIYICIYNIQYNLLESNTIQIETKRITFPFLLLFFLSFSLKLISDKVIAIACSYSYRYRDLSTYLLPHSLSLDIFTNIGDCFLGVRFVFVFVFVLYVCICINSLYID